MVKPGLFRSVDINFTVIIDIPKAIINVVLKNLISFKLQKIYLHV